jgi:hypothetical protein
MQIYRSSQSSEINKKKHSHTVNYTNMYCTINSTWYEWRFLEPCLNRSSNLQYHKLPQRLSPRPNWDPPPSHPLSPKQVCPPPPETKGGWGGPIGEKA